MAVAEKVLATNGMKIVFDMMEMLKIISFRCVDACAYTDLCFEPLDFCVLIF